MDTEDVTHFGSGGLQSHVTCGVLFTAAPTVSKSTRLRPTAR
jgi:hypothetical protein